MGCNVIMIQGTASNAGKSLLAAGLCRIFARDGYRVAPFKSQNMALNSYVTADGLEMGRAQVTQAQCAGIAPDVRMNPILLKPTSDKGSQVIVMGEVLGNMTAREYYARKPKLLEPVLDAYHSLARENDIIVVEGAGSPAEINLKADDFVNMGLAKRIGAPVLLAGDIDRGGVFAALAGTHLLLDPAEKAHLKGVIINKFRGDKTILEPGLVQLEELIHTPVVGVVPFINVDIDDEDSLTDRFARRTDGILDIVVIRLPRISNFTDFLSLSSVEGVGLRYVDSAAQLGNPDLLILPGSKNTMGDLLWLRQCGLEAAIQKHAAAGGIVFGICGGYQMLGEVLSDPHNLENGGEMAGLGLLPGRTEFGPQKARRQVHGRFGKLEGALSGLEGAKVEGYEIHMGVTENIAGARPTALLEPDARPDGMNRGNIYGSYVHGIFDGSEVVDRLLKALLNRKGLSGDALHTEDPTVYRERQFDLLEKTLRESLDMRRIYNIMKEGVLLDRIVKPQQIETESFAIITRELGDKALTPGAEPIIKRVIHTSADFDYADNLVFTDGVVDQAKRIFRDKPILVTDTNMAKAGVNKAALAKLEGEIHCFIADEDVARVARDQGTTRAVAAMDKAARLQGDRPLVLVIGNAPTAILRLLELHKQGDLLPALVIGVPVGFVNVVESKELLLESGLPAIVARGRKGGSNVAAAICNAIMYECCTRHF